jgi:hypothetical protein
LTNQSPISAQATKWSTELKTSLYVSFSPEKSALGNIIFTYVIASIASLLPIYEEELRDYFCTTYLPLLYFDMMVIVFACVFKPVMTIGIISVFT